MSFGFGVGDILAVSKLARSIWKQFQDSPDHFKAIRTEVAGLQLLLDDVSENISDRQLSEKQKEDLSSLTGACRDVLKELEAMVQKYGILATENSTFGGRIRKSSKKLGWDQDGVRDLRSRITSNTTLLNAFNSGLASATHKAKADVLERRIEGLQINQENQERQAIIDWLSPLNFPAQQSAFFNRRQEGTGSWLLQSAEFKKWMSTSGETLICRGMPGAGKTILASIVIDYIQSRLHSDQTGLVYLYCDYRRQLEQIPVNLIASLLKQLLQHQTSVSEEVRKVYQCHIRTKSYPDLEEIFKLLRNTVASFSQLYIVVDALDELPISGHVRQNLLAKLGALQASYPTNLLITSRFIPHITDEFQNPLCLEIRASEEDVRRYVRGHMIELPNCVRKSPTLQEIILDTIVNVVDGMFLLAQLHVDSLTDKTSPKAIKKALEKLPMGIDALDIAYDQAMQRIEDQKPGFKTLAKQALCWITYAQRLLTVTELRHALAIELGESQFDEENLDDMEDILSACAGLVIVDQETEAQTHIGTARLVHYTTQDYFKRTGPRHFPNAHQSIGASCLTYLQLDAFEGGICDIRKEKGDNYYRNYFQRREVALEARIQKNPFLEYAAFHWGNHTTVHDDPDIKEAMMRFLKNDYMVSSAFEVLSFKGRRSSYVEEYNCSSCPWSGIHIVAFLGLQEVMLLLLDEGFEADKKDADNCTPLSWAAREGHDVVVGLLVGRKDVDVNTCTRTGQKSPLHFAAENGHEAVVELLLNRKDVNLNLKDWEGMTSLLGASSWGHKAVVEILLARKDVEADSRGESSRTPLSWAAQQGSEELVKLFLARKDIEVDSKDESGRTPLSYAARRGGEGVVKLLLARGDVKADSKDESGITPLSHAVESGYEGVVKLFLARKDIEADSKDESGRTPLSYAARRGGEGVVKLLLAREDVEADSKDKWGKTPLSHAAGWGDEEVVKLLLAREDVEADSKDKSGRPPLSYAAESGREGVVKLLLAREDVEADSKDKSGRPPLSYAAESGREGVVKLFLAREDVNVNSTDREGQTPLSKVVEEAEYRRARDYRIRRYDAIVELLRSAIEARS